MFETLINKIKNTMAKKKATPSTSTKFSQGDKVNFKRNALVFGENVSISAVDSENKFYIIENEYGWTPDESRLKKYELNKNKKYLFVNEQELS